MKLILALTFFAVELGAKRGGGSKVFLKFQRLGFYVCHIQYVHFRVVVAAVAPKVAAVAPKVAAVLVVFLEVVAPDQNQRLPVETRNIFLFSKY